MVPECTRAEEAEHSHEDAPPAKKGSKMSKYQSCELLRKHDIVRKDPEEKAKLYEIENDLAPSQELLQMPQTSSDFEQDTNEYFNKECNTHMSKSKEFKHLSYQEKRD